MQGSHEASPVLDEGWGGGGGVTERDPRSGGAKETTYAHRGGVHG